MVLKSQSILFWSLTIMCQSLPKLKSTNKRAALGIHGGLAAAVITEVERMAREIKVM